MEEEGRRGKQNVEKSEGLPRKNRGRENRVDMGVGGRGEGLGGRGRCPKDAVFECLREDGWGRQLSLLEDSP